MLEELISPIPIVLLHVGALFLFVFVSEENYFHLELVGLVDFILVEIDNFSCLLAGLLDFLAELSADV